MTCTRCKGDLGGTFVRFRMSQCLRTEGGVRELDAFPPTDFCFECVDSEHDFGRTMQQIGDHAVESVAKGSSSDTGGGSSG